jgi:predicted ATPase
VHDSLAMKTDEDDNAGNKFDGLIGRDHELETLKQIFENVISNKETGKAAATQVVLISGPTGVGKTALAASLEHLVAQENGGFFVAKFDELTQLLNPSSACTNAIDSILRGVYEDGRGADLLRVIHDDLADGKFDVEELDRLTTLFPTFATIVKEGGLRSDPTSEKDLASNQKLLVSSNAATGMLKESLRLLRKSISRLYRVTVVLFDDLHWADESMLDVFTALTEDATSTSTVFVGTYRDNRTSPAFLRFLQTLQQSRRVALTEMRLKGIGKACYASLVWAVIGLDEDRITDKSTCRALVDVLYQRTSGYVFYTREFLHVLLSSGMIDLKDGVLSCDMTSAKENFGTTLEDILVYKLSKLPVEVLQMLRVSSCMGSTMKEEILKLLLQQPVEHVRALLLDALKHGIIVRRATQDENCYLWSFSHDAFKEALYNIMSEADRAKLHHAIGLQLSECSTTSESIDLLFLVTSQMLLGAAVMPQASEITIARLCLRAGERATQSSSFWTARDFFVRGMDLLERGSTWDQEYNLFLQLYSAAAEVSYCTGRLNDAHKYADVILRQASCKRDRYRAQAVKLYSFGGSFETDEAINYVRSSVKCAKSSSSRSHVPGFQFASTGLWSSNPKKKVSDTVMVDSTYAQAQNPENRY